MRFEAIQEKGQAEGSKGLSKPKSEMCSLFALGTKCPGSGWKAV